MKKLLLTLVLLLPCQALAWPYLETSPDGYSVRIVNPDPQPYYCWIQMTGGFVLEKLLYPGNVTMWYPARDVYNWGCK